MDHHTRASTTCLLLCAFLFVKTSSFSTKSIIKSQFVGFDLGTSGARVSVIQQGEEGSSLGYQEIYSKAIPWSEKTGVYDDPSAWIAAIDVLLEGAAKTLASLDAVRSICVSGTSSSCLVIDTKDAGTVTRAPRMYDFNVVNSQKDPVHSLRAMALLEKYSPAKHTVLSPTGTLAKLLSWNEEKRLSPSEIMCHQADYAVMHLLSNDKACGSGGNQRSISTDWQNCLKLGYDVRKLEWPPWLLDCITAAGMSAKVLPSQVVSPGEPLGVVSASTAKRFGLSLDTVVVGGTTDSNAAFFAASGPNPAMGTAVTSLGSTMAIKQLSRSYVEDATLGVYSHRYPSVLSNEYEEAWLVGGASNVGCAVLRQLQFSNEELSSLSHDIDPSKESPLSYYPLTGKGERFPFADSSKEPLLSPVPDDRREFLHGILQGISSVERDGFLALGELGAVPPQPTQVLTCGGGSRNGMWSKMRQRRLQEAFSNQVEVTKAGNVEASYGAAILAAASFQQ